MRRRALLAGMAAGTLAGCSGQEPDDGTVRLDYLCLAWQKESVRANRQLVAEWNRRHPGIRVRYVQGNWDTVHDQLLTSFEGGSAPDVIHDEAGDLTDFAHGGYLADLGPLLPERLRANIPQRTWDTASFAGGVYGVPFLQEPRVLIANARLLRRSGVRVPTVQRPWSWGEFEDAARRLTRGGTRHGVAWSMKEPVSQTLNLSLTQGGRIFYRSRGKNQIRFDAPDSALAELVRRQVHQEHSAARSSLGMSGSDTLPGFFAGRYALLPLNFSFRQQVHQQAPDGFDWITLPLPGDPGAHQGVSPQTLSISEDCRHKRAAMAFVAHLTEPDHQVRLAQGDWLLPTSPAALRDPRLDVARHGWRVGVETAPSLVASPVLGVRGYPEWTDKVATPALQRYYGGDLSLDALRDRLVDDGNRVLRRYQR
ncbi:extracellular solute-binding protein [Streptomyces sp. NPDC005438]|uniref:ABC transporter substrate-binding protein n=1 Tax=Streptomyces sp. NPDC005438 TaxID=3156880 RepID=UPI0033B6F380